jgi:hypothetical protein
MKVSTMGREARLAPTRTLAQDEGEDEAGVTRGHVHHRAAGEVHRLDRGLGVPDTVEDTVDAPHAMREREVDDEHPAADEDHQGRELHALGDTADDQRRGDDGEGELEHRIDVLADPVTVVAVGRGVHAFQHGELQVTER